MRRDHQYVAYRKFTHKTLGGTMREFPRGAIVTERNGYLIMRDGEPICTTHSQNGRQFFAPNYDGNGLERGDIAYALTEASRKNRVGFRFNATEREELQAKWGKYLQSGDVILFNDDLFTAPIPELRQLADRFLLRPKEVIHLRSDMFQGDDS